MLRSERHMDTLVRDLQLFERQAREALKLFDIDVDQNALLFSGQHIDEARSGSWNGCAIELRDKLEKFLRQTLTDFHAFEKHPYIQRIYLPDKTLDIAIINDQAKLWYGSQISVGAFDFVLESE